MPSDTGSSGQVDLIQQQIDKLSQECAAMTAAFATARRVRILLALALVVFVVVVCYAFYRLGNGLLQEDYQQRLTHEAEVRLDKNQEKYMRHVQLLVDRTSPAISDAFTKQVSKDTPIYLKIMDKERDIMAKDLETKLGKRMQERYEALLDRHQKVLTEELPSAKDEKLHERMTTNLKIALDEILKKYYVGELEKQLKILFQTWDEFPMADTPKKGERPLEEQFSVELFRLIAIKLGSTQRP